MCYISGEMWFLYSYFLNISRHYNLKKNLRGFEFQHVQKFRHLREESEGG